MEIGKKRGSDPLAERFLGSCLGLLVGDALGAPVEGWAWPRINQEYGWLDGMVRGRLPAGSYTDDGQMAIGLLESLVKTTRSDSARSGSTRSSSTRFDPAGCAARWLANYDPGRGYGGRLDGIMDRLRSGESWDSVGTDSFGNGAAMRIGPLGAWYHGDRKELVGAARESAFITHRHPQAMAGAIIQGLAVGQALAQGLAGEPLAPERFLEPLIHAAKETDPESARRLESLVGIRPGEREELRKTLTTLYACDVRAIESVGPALGAVLGTRSFKEAVILAVNLGGDTDTLGAMAGAVAGAYYGLSAIPEEWLEDLENGPGNGRDYMIELSLKGVEIMGNPF